MDFKEKESSPGELSENKKYCTDCKTTKTPLWRGGPAGPKSLCNACGIRYRKKRASVSVVGGQEMKRERGGNRWSTTTASDLRVKLMSVEEEQAAVCLMAHSYGFIFAI